MCIRACFIMDAWAVILHRLAPLPLTCEHDVFELLEWSSDAVSVLRLRACAPMLRGLAAPLVVIGAWHVHFEVLSSELADINAAHGEHLRDIGWCDSDEGGWW